tara:strand:+ start:481 stop:729 length:249 start_codon:yes stop_codon:yes gene_type:complete
MQIAVNQEIELFSEPIKLSYFTNQGLLNSNYKSVVNQNFSKSNSKSVFGIRQRLKSSQLDMVNHTAVILRLSVFAMFLIALF